MEPVLPEMNNRGERKLTLLVVLVELMNWGYRLRQLPLFLPGEGISETYDELIFLGWFNRAVLWQALDDGNGAVKLLLGGRHCRISRW